MTRSFPSSALTLGTIGFILSVGCAPAEAPAERSQDLDLAAELAPEMLDENGQPFDYVYDPSSPWLPATKRLLFKPLKADAYDDIRWYAPQNYAITEPPASANVRPMVEWEPMKSLILQWPSGYLGNTSASQTFLDIATNASVVADVWIITDPGGTGSMKQALSQNGVSNASLANKFYFLETEIDSIWFIDSGPLPIIDKTKNSFSFADFRYYHERAYDDGVSTVLARNLTNMGMAANTATYRMPVKTEGGTFQGTSDGICFTGTRQLYYQSCDQGGCDKNTGGSPAWSGTKYVNINTVQNHSMNKQLKEEWGKYLGCKDVLVTHSVTDDGTGHLDMYFKIVDDNTILLGDYKPPYQANTAQAENAALLDETAAFLEAYTKPGGGKFTVHRMIMPGHRSTNEGMVPFTYLNSTFINGVNLWPAYSYPEWIDSRNEAEAKWEDVMPNYQHIWINSETLSFWSGAIHCITRTVPALSPGPWVADGTCNNDMCVAPAGGYDADCTPNALQTPVCWGPDWVCACNDCDGPCADDAGPLPEGCGDISWEGCCEGNELKYCEGNQIKGGPCQNGCGWDDEGSYYNCGGQGEDPSGQSPLECVACQADCQGKACGSDGCGGSCGSCDPGETCNGAGICEGCNPSCGANECGSDGCGGSCGVCADGQTCDAGQCVAEVDGCGGISWEGCCDVNTLKYCDNDAITELNCGSCGWNAQGNYYDCQQEGADPSGAFPIDCPGECVPACDGIACGPDGCGGSCGACLGGQICNEFGACDVVCVAECANVECGDDGCGGSCGACDMGESCGPNGLCEAGCAPSCANKVCGDDGCGASCGQCGPDQECTLEGLCIDSCVPQCGDIECGSDGCAGTCGACPLDQVCNANGLCVEDCKPLCGGKICGDDGCGSTCGTCLEGETCTPQGLCEQGCQTDCEGKVCGGDGCGGSCGSCPGGMLCDEAGQCVDEPDGCGDVSAKGECDGNTVVWCQGGVVESFDCEAQGKICGVKDDVGFTCIDPNACVPSCDAKICGDDGCGGTCGSCNVGSECLDGACVDPDPTDPTDPTDPVDPNDPSVNDGDKDKGENSGGCQTGSSPSPLPMAAWSLVLLLVLGLRRRRNSKS